MTILSVAIMTIMLGTCIASGVMVTHRSSPSLASLAMTASIFGLMATARLAERGSLPDLVLVVGLTVLFTSVAFQSWRASRPKDRG